MRSITSASLRANWSQLLSSPSPIILCALVLGNASLALIANQVVLQDWANIGDEYSYQLSARTLADGKLSVPSPEPREFFDYLHIVNDGKFYSKYPPGWPLVLSLGYIFGAPWLVNPIICALTLFLVYRTVREHFSREAATMALLLALGNPSIVYLSATYHSHPTCLLFTVVLICAYFRILSDFRRRWAYVTVGAAAGMVFLVRPFTAVLLLVPLSLFLLYRARQAGELRIVSARALLAAVPFTLLMCFFLYYNYSLTGDPLLMPFTKYDPLDKPALPTTAEEFHQTFVVNFAMRLLRINIFFPLSLFIIVIFLCNKQIRASVKGVLLLVMCGGLVVGYSFYHHNPNCVYGPRYIYEGSFSLIVIAALTLNHYRALAPVVLAVILSMNVNLMLGLAEQRPPSIKERKVLFEEVARKGLSNAIVFLDAGSGTIPIIGCTRNGISFDETVLYVHDLGPRNKELLKNYPDRTAYVWGFDVSHNRVTLRPYSEVYGEE